jgi:hypothetical protein
MNDPHSYAAGSLTSILAPLAVGLLVVIRFLVRELRDRRIPFNRFFVFPAIFGVISVALVYFAASTAPYYVVQLAAGSFAAVVVGIGIGLAVDRFTSVRLGPSGTSAIIRGSWMTVAIWIAALALRLVGRYFIFGVGPKALGVTLTLNAALVLMLFAAMVVLRVRLFARAGALRGGQLAV